MEIDDIKDSIIDNALARFTHSIEKLDAAVHSRKHIDSKVDDLLKELEVLRIDRGKLASELDHARGRISSLELARSESLHRVITVIDNVRMVIDMDKGYKKS